MIKNHVPTILFALILIGCSGGGETNSNEKEEAPKSTSTDQPVEKVAEVNEDLLPGLLEVNIAGEDYSVSEFDKRRSEITYTDEAAMVRLTSLDKSRSLQVLLKSSHLAAPKPVDASLNVQNDNKVGITFQGFLGPKDSISSIVIIDGVTTILEFNESSRLVEATFSGTAFHQQMIGKKMDTVEVKGKIRVQLDHDVDTRRK